MLQRRAEEKYHSSCGGHPPHGEETNVAAHRRSREEMGFDCALSEVSILTAWYAQSRPSSIPLPQ
ncbi:NUDIX domain-containing protein [Pseudomonas chlororaphis]|uniref:NUDIX domain-containing protein n=1 Tax=Pseudomonas chlororaphis TaxID=587753 RepID=UPI001389A1DE